MNQAVQNVINAIESFEEDTDSIIIELLKEREKEMTSMNVNEQLYNLGIDSLGVKLDPPYATSTRKRKRRKGQPDNRVTLKDEGDFHQSLIFDYRDDTVAIGSDDPKFQYLSRKYGDQILGLTPENLARLSEMVKDNFVNIARKRIVG